MNCYEHPQQPAVAQCPDCRKGLCRECTSNYSIPICPACNKRRINAEKVEIVKELLLTFGVGILLTVLFVKWSSSGEHPLKHNIMTYIIFAYIFCGIVPGWRALSGITSGVFLFLPLIGYVFYFVIKLLLSFGVGLVMFPVRTLRNIVRLGTLQKIRV